MIARQWDGGNREMVDYRIRAKVNNPSGSWVSGVSGLNAPDNQLGLAWNGSAPHCDTATIQHHSKHQPYTKYQIP